MKNIFKQIAAVIEAKTQETFNSIPYERQLQIDRYTEELEFVESQIKLLEKDKRELVRLLVNLKEQ